MLPVASAATKAPEYEAPGVRPWAGLYGWATSCNARSANPFAHNASRHPTLLKISHFLAKTGRKSGKSFLTCRFWYRILRGSYSYFPYTCPSSRTDRAIWGRHSPFTCHYLVGLYLPFFLFFTNGVSCEESQAPTIINASATKYVTSGISLNMANERIVAINGAIA